MYVPRAFAVDDSSVTLELLRRVGVGHLVTVGRHGAFDATVLPFLVDDSLTVVRAHLARANPQWRGAEGLPALLVVPVDGAYVSPAWYPSKRDDPRVVPTLNYEVVHLHGTLVVHDDATWVAQLVRALTDHREQLRIDRGDGPPRWSIDDAPADYVERQCKAIVGVELVVDRVEAKRKLSQNRSDSDRVGVAAALARSSSHRDQAVAAAMQEPIT